MATPVTAYMDDAGKIWQTQAEADLADATRDPRISNHYRSDRLGKVLTVMSPKYGQNPRSRLVLREHEHGMSKTHLNLTAKGWVATKHIERLFVKED